LRFLSEENFFTANKNYRLFILFVKRKKDVRCQMSDVGKKVFANILHPTSDIFRIYERKYTQIVSRHGEIYIFE